MVDAYYEATKDKSFIQQNIDFMDQEFNYWMVNRTKIFRDLNGKEHQLARYNVQVDDPRPGKISLPTNEMNENIVDFQNRTLRTTEMLKHYKALRIKRSFTET